MRFLAQALALLLLGVLMLLTPAFTMLQVGSSAGFAVKENGYEFLDNFSLFLADGEADLLRTQGWACAFNWATLVLGLAALLGGIGCLLACFTASSLNEARRYDAAVQTMRTLILTALIAFAALTVAYLTLGAVMRGKLVTGMSDSYKKLIKTFAYFPLILAAASVFTYLFVRLKLTEQPLKKTGGVGLSERERLELLAEYSELYRSGVLTETEFNARKRSLLDAEQPPEAAKEAAAAEPEVPTSDSEAESDGDVTNVLLEYKRLYDEGVITEEEFAQRKKTLLELE